MFKPFVVSVLACLLVGCQQELSYDDLMHHPSVLKREMDKCQAPGVKSTEQTARCEIVMSAADSFVTILNEQQSDPEAFGARVMTAQSDAVKDKVIYFAAQDALVKLQTEHADADAIDAAQKTVDTTKKAFLAKRQEVETLLAVIGVNSPE